MKCDDLTPSVRLRPPWATGLLGVLLLGLALLGPGCGGPPAPEATGAPPVEAAAEPGEDRPAGEAPGAPEDIRLDPSMLAPGPPVSYGDAYLFTLLEPDAESVAVVGTFNGWVPTADPHARSGDLWYALVEVPLGGHKYRFLIDGSRWALDPDNDRRAKDSLGNITSALTVRR